MTNEDRSNDLMPLMKRGSETDAIALELLAALGIATNRAYGATAYRPARAQAISLARQCYRAAVALAFREQLIASAAQGHQPYRSRHDAYVSPYASTTPGRWEGD